MKNFNNVFLSAFVICLFSQCENAAEVNPVKEQKFRISSFTFGNGDVSSTLTYNDNEILVTQSNFYNDEVLYTYTLYKTDDEGRIIYIKEYSYDENCAMEKFIDYTKLDRVVCTAKVVNNQCETHSISTYTYYLDDQGNWFSSEMESEIGFTSKKEYEVTNGNIISITEPAYNYVKQYKYDLDNEVPENIRIMNSIVSADELWYGKNLLIEHTSKNNEEEAFIIKNEYSFDEHGNIVEIRRFNKSGGDQDFRPWNTLNFTYEAIDE